MDSIGFSARVCRHLQIEKARWASYPVGSMIEMLVQSRVEPVAALRAE